MMNTLETLQQRFGFDSFREGQEKVINSLLEGKSAAAVFPTGAGKSLCYQLPAILLPGLTLVVSPLLALMKDQVDALLEKQIAAARLDSSLTSEEYAEVLSKARSGEIKLLYVAPERFNNERFRQAVKRFRISLMAIDEAHCVSEWGHNFRPDYLKLARYAEFCGAERILALTATATPRVLEDICRRFDLDVSVRTPFHRPNLHLKAGLAGSAQEKMRELYESLRQREPGPSIVYVTLQKTAEDVAGQLADQGFPARPYHAGLDPQVRAETQEWFLTSDHGIVVATIAFGMGIDKPNIRAVYHYDPPKSLENYSQEIGRAGRDGEVSLCQFFFHPPDRIPLENFVYGDTPTAGSIESLLQEVFGGTDELVLNLYQLGREHDLRPLVLRTILTYLELDNFLEALTPIYTKYQFKPQTSSKEMLSHYQGEQLRLMASILKHSVKKRIWFEIDIEGTATKLGCERGQVVSALDTLGIDGWLEIKASDLRFRYAVRRRPEDVAALAQELHIRAVEREGAEIGRLREALELATETGCLAARVAAHFGETLAEPCGVCSSCSGETRSQINEGIGGDFELGEIPQGISDARTLTRFLCGLTSPSLQKAKLHKHPRFGELGHISFARVLEEARVLIDR